MEPGIERYLNETFGLSIPAHTTQEQLVLFLAERINYLIINDFSSLVNILRWAQSKPWYDAYYAGIPLFNGMKMKSGTIGGAKAYAGYHTSKSGTEYTFAIIINNYDDATWSIVPKMFKVLNELK